MYLRMLSSLKNKKVDHIVRITGDDILIDPDYLDIAIRSHLRTNSDYTDHKKLTLRHRDRNIFFEFTKKYYAHFFFIRRF